MREKGQDRRQKGDSSPAPARPGSDFVMERFGSIRDMDRSFDIEYWNAKAMRRSIAPRGNLSSCTIAARARTRMNSDFRDLLRIFNAR